MEEILTYSGLKLAEMIRKGEISSRDVVLAHIERIKRVNPLINALVKDRFETAIVEAENVDNILKNSRRENLPPYFGVPCTVKECFAIKGMPLTGGLVSRKNLVASEDSTVVKRLKEAGAIILGITNVPELGMWMETYNKVYGLTRNPYDLRRTAGGSSGGEGAIISAGGSPFGIGSDLGGSIRLPAFFNGIFGHKPSGGLVPNTGQFPCVEGEALRFLTPGPLCRKAEDLFPLLKVIAGPDGKDPSVRNDIELKDPSEVKIEKIRVINIPSNGIYRVSEELLHAQRKCLSFLKMKGAECKDAEIKYLKYSLPVWATMLQENQEITFTELMGEGKKLKILREFLKWIFRLSSHTLPALSLSIIENLMKIVPSSRKERFIKLGKKLKEIFTEMLGENGIILYPTYPVPAPLHFVPLLKPFAWIYTGIVNVLEFPSTQVPLGLNRKGLPLGIQVIGPYGNDHIPIKVAMEIEKELGGWIPPRIKC